MRKEERIEQEVETVKFEIIPIERKDEPNISKGMIRYKIQEEEEKE